MPEPRPKDVIEQLVNALLADPHLSPSTHQALQAIADEIAPKSPQHKEPHKP